VLDLHTTQAGSDSKKNISNCLHICTYKKGEITPRVGVDTTNKGWMDSHAMLTLSTARTSNLEHSLKIFPRGSLQSEYTSKIQDGKKFDKYRRTSLTL